MSRILILILFVVFQVDLFSASRDSLIIVLVNGEKIAGVKLVELKENELVCEYSEQLLSFKIDSIGRIIIGRDTKLWRGIIMGAGIGLAVGVIPGVIVLSSVEKEKEPLAKMFGFIAGVVIVAIYGGVGLVAGAVIGGVVEAILGKDTICDVAGMSQDKKFELIERLFEKYKK